MNAVQLFDRLLDPVTEAFSVDVARRVLALRADEETEKRGSEVQPAGAAKRPGVQLADLLNVLAVRGVSDLLVVKKAWI